MAVHSSGSVILVADTAADLTPAIGYEGSLAYVVDTGLVWCKGSVSWEPKAATLGVGTPTLVGGHVPTSQLGSGTPGVGNFLRGDGTWSTTPGGGYSGLSSVNFGTGAGLTYTETFVPLAVSGPTVVNAWITPIATADHSVDEHLVEEVSVNATFEDGVGITIYGTAPGSPLTGEFSVAWSLE